MPTPLSRTDREVVEVSGVGGMLKFGHPVDQVTAAPLFLILDITSWRLRHTLYLANVTHSGAYGGQKMAMTGRHWEAQLALSFNTKEAPERSVSGFLENAIIGNQSAGYNVATVFFLGDPISYVTSNHIQRPSAKLYAPLALAGNIEIVNDASGKDVVRATASMQGNSKLQGWTGLGEELTFKVF